MGGSIAGDPRRILRQPAILSAILFLATLFVFRDVRHFEFINFDDPEYVTGNPQVRNGLSMDGILWAFTTTHASNWHPVTWISHMLDSTLFGENPAGPHVENLLFHAANAGLIFFFLRGVTGRLWPSFWVAAIFALHPLRVESVAWVSERKDVLSTFFWVLTLIAYARYTVLKERAGVTGSGERPTPEETTSYFKSDAGRWYFFALVAFALGLMSKPMLVTTPFLLLLIDYWPLRRILLGTNIFELDWVVNKSRVRTLILEKLPFLGLSVACAFMTFIAQHHAGAVVSIERLPLSSRGANALISVARYIGKSFWPANLAVPYPLASHWAWSQVMIAGIFVLGTCVLAVWWTRHRPYFFTGWFWFLGTLLPVIGLVQVGNQAMADRYTYVPSIGFSIAIAWLLLELSSAAGWHCLLGGVAILSVAACAWKTNSQLQYWKNSETLFRHALKVTEGNFLSHDNLGFQLYQTGRIEEAMKEYREALQIHPADANTLNNVGSLLSGTGNYEGAINAYEAALNSQPDFSDAHNNLGVALAHLNKIAEAERHYREALRLDPKNAEAHSNLANLLAMGGKVDEAIFHYRMAIAIDPHFTQGLNNLGYLLGQRGEFQAAKEIYLKAIRIKPNDAKLHSNFADVLAKAGRAKEAKEHYETALRLAPNLADAHLGLGILLAHQGKPIEALEHLRKAVTLNPTDPDTQRELDALEKALAVPGNKP